MFISFFMTSEVYKKTIHLFQEGPAEDYKLNNDEHGTHLKFYDCRYNSATYTIFITN